MYSLASLAATTALCTILYPRFSWKEMVKLQKIARIQGNTKMIFLACLLIMLPLAGGCPDCTVAVEAVAVTGAFSVISIASSCPAAPLVAVT